MKNQQGRITQILGAVIDVEFLGEVPPVFTALTVGDLVLEVEQILGNHTVRAIAMGPTEGLSRNLPVISTGSPITVPVGEDTLGRIFNVLGEVVDEGDIFLILRVGGGLTAAKSLIKCSEAFRAKGKTVLAVWMTSRKYAEESRRLLIENRIPVYTTPLRAMKAASALVEYARFLQSRASDSF